MKWTESKSSFTYNGKPVTRHKMVAVTPVITFTVYESVGGSCFFYTDKMTNGWADPYNEFGQPKVPCKDIQHGVATCEKLWSKLKQDILNT